MSKVAVENTRVIRSVYSGDVEISVSILLLYSSGFVFYPTTGMHIVRAT